MPIEEHEMHYVNYSLWQRQDFIHITEITELPKADKRTTKVETE